MGDLTIYTLGNAQFLADMFIGLRLFISSHGLVPVALGAVIGLFLYGIKSVVTGRFEFGYLLGSLFLGIILFTTDKQTFIEDYSTGVAIDVGDIPLGLSLPYSVATTLGHSITTGLETSFQPPSTVVGIASTSTAPSFSSSGFLGPLRSIMATRDIGLPANTTQTTSINVNGRYSKTIKEYIQVCFKPYQELPGYQPKVEEQAKLWAAFEVPIVSWPVTNYLDDINGVTTNCGTLYTNLSTVIDSQDFVDEAKGIIGRKAHKDATQVEDDLNWYLGNTSDAELFMRNYVVRHSLVMAERTGGANYANSISSIMEAEAISKRQVQAGVEQAQFMEKATTYLTFIEGFLVFTFPISMLLIMLGTLGLKTAVGYLTGLIWINIWPICLLIVNNYTFSAISNDFASSGFVETTSWAAMDSIYTTSASWMATAGELAVLVPTLAAFILSGSISALVGAASVNQSAASSAVSTGSPETPKMRNGSYSDGPHIYQRNSETGKIFKGYQAVSNSQLSQVSVQDAVKTDLSQNLDSSHNEAVSKSLDERHALSSSLTKAAINTASELESYSKNESNATASGESKALQASIGGSSGKTSNASLGSNIGGPITTALIAGSALLKNSAFKDELLSGLTPGLADKIRNGEGALDESEIEQLNKKARKMSPSKGVPKALTQLLQAFSMSGGLNAFLTDSQHEALNEALGISKDQYQALAYASSNVASRLKSNSSTKAISDQLTLTSTKASLINDTYNDAKKALLAIGSQISQSKNSDFAPILQTDQADNALREHWGNSQLDESTGMTYDEFISHSQSSNVMNPGDIVAARGAALSHLMDNYVTSGQIANRQLGHGLYNEKSNLEQLFGDMGAQSFVDSPLMDKQQEVIDAISKLSGINLDQQIPSQITPFGQAVKDDPQFKQLTDNQGSLPPTSEQVIADHSTSTQVDQPTDDENPVLPGNANALKDKVKSETAGEASADFTAKERARILETRQANQQSVGTSDVAQLLSRASNALSELLNGPATNALKFILPDNISGSSLASRIKDGVVLTKAQQDGIDLLVNSGPSADFSSLNHHEMQSVLDALPVANSIIDSYASQGSEGLNNQQIEALGNLQANTKQMIQSISEWGEKNQDTLAFASELSDQRNARTTTLGMGNSSDFEIARQSSKHSSVEDVLSSDQFNHYKPHDSEFVSDLYRSYLDSNSNQSNASYGEFSEALDTIKGLTSGSHSTDFSPQQLQNANNLLPAINEELKKADKGLNSDQQSTVHQSYQDRRNALQDKVNSYSSIKGFEINDNQPIKPQIQEAMFNTLPQSVKDSFIHKNASQSTFDFGDTKSPNANVRREVSEILDGITANSSDSQIIDAFKEFDTIARTRGNTRSELKRELANTASLSTPLIKKDNLLGLDVDDSSNSEPSNPRQARSYPETVSPQLKELIQKSNSSSPLNLDQYSNDQLWSLRNEAKLNEKFSLVGKMDAFLDLDKITKSDGVYAGGEVQTYKSAQGPVVSDQDINLSAAYSNSGFPVFDERASYEANKSPYTQITEAAEDSGFSVNPQHFSESDMNWRGYHHDIFNQITSMPASEREENTNNYINELRSLGHKKIADEIDSYKSRAFRDSFN